MGLIAISGKKGAGKNTVASLIQYLIWKNRVEKRELTLVNYTIRDFRSNGFVGGNLSEWEQKSFAGKLKKMVSMLTNIRVDDLEDQDVKDRVLGKEWTKVDILPDNPDEEWTPTVRWLLQTLGTDVMRDRIHPDIWVNALFADIDKELNINVNKLEYKSDYVYTEPVFIKNLEGKYNLYKCCCGNEFKADKYKIKTKHTKSCGCYQKYKAGLTQFKDGRKGTRLWNIYNNMIQRCENKNHPRYSDYGGRGIIVSDEFKPFENFKKWAFSNGYNNTLSIDRIDNNDIYCSDNCKFSSDSEQVINTRDRSDNSSGYRGVSKDKHKWRASIQIEGKQKFLGYFNTPEEASIVYEKSFLERKELYGKKQIKKGFIITDMRFPNELKAVKDRGGITIRVERPGLVESNHLSETSLDSATFDFIINNDGSIDDLLLSIKKILKKLKML